MSRLTLWTALALGCTAPQPLEDPTHPTGSGTVASLPNGHLVAVNVDEGTVSLVDGAGAVLDEAYVGGEPTRITRGADGVYVTLRFDGEVVALAEDDGRLHITQRVAVGSEPYGIVASEDGQRVYVAVSRDERVVELDASLTALRSWSTPGEPRWLALHPGNRALMVASFRGEPLRRVDLAHDRVEAVELPAMGVTSNTLADPFGGAVARVTGDPGFSPDGQTLGVPLLFIVPDLQSTTQLYYTPPPDPNLDAGRMTPAVAALPVDPRGQPNGDSDPLMVPGGIAAQPDMVRRGVPTSVSFTGDGRWILATVEGANVVVALDLDPQVDEAAHHGLEATRMTLRPWTLIETGAAPRGIAWTTDGAWVHTAFDRSVAPLPSQADLVTGSVQEYVLQTDPRTHLGPSALSEEVLRGRQLFFSTTDGRVGNPGISCATCHVDGRDDGVTWSIGDDVRRQTPSLAGNVSDTVPLTWTSEVMSVAEEADLTSTGRMGGTGLGEDDLQAIAAFIDAVRLPQPPTVTTPDLVAQGEALFHRSDVGCARCHSGPTFADGRHHALFGLEAVNTPSLLGIAATAPYLHDGRAETLREVLTQSAGGAMGHPELLSPPQTEALLAYLRTL